MLHLNVVKAESEISQSNQTIDDAAPPKIIDFFEARKKSLEQAKENDRHFELSQEILAHREPGKRTVIIRDPIEDVLFLFLVVAIATGVVLLALGGSG